jgi:MoaA/NifB/PqqE/SkfB family radical SAM enzyme
MGIRTFSGVIINPGCKSHCRFCGSCERPTPEKLLEQERRVAKNLEEFRRDGCEWVEISGSDPIEYENIVPLIRYMKGGAGEKGFEFVQLATHGRRLSDREFVVELIDSGLDSLRVPIYGSRAEIHDYATGAEGSFAETVNGLMLVRRVAPGMRILLHTLIMRHNRDDLIGIVGLAREIGAAEGMHISVPCLAERDDSYYLPFRELAPYARRLYSHIKENGLKVHFLDIPFCVFGEYEPSYMANDNRVANLGSHCQPQKIFESGVKDLASYRLKKKVEICQGCSCDSVCAGFYKNDVEKFGTGTLKPIS